ncbi:MAG: 16S rRNA (cytosine(967)-C(5))-methyltransferase RsmB [Clostridia bacterium]|nr:16S rRNA (cytosine(967)-C(5))-methyltransferase RsmB [Clostridia bacterium]
MADKTSARTLAFHSLLKCFRDRRYSNIEIDSVIKQNNLDSREKGLFTALVYGVIEKRLMLDYIISSLSHRPCDNIVPAVMTVLEMGIYQILFFDRVPDSAACNESVETAKKLAGEGAGKFVNAILREIVRKKDNIESLFDRLEGDEYLSIRYSVPVWIINILKDSYGQEKAVEIIKAFEGKSYMTLRTNTLRATREGLVQTLKNGGIDAEVCQGTKWGVDLLQSVPTDRLEKIAGGLYIVQDKSSQIAVERLSVEKGDFIIDCCACPGGKSISSAFCAENDGSILSLDLHKNKLSLVEKSAGAMGIDIIKTMEHNGTTPLEEYIGKADKVICDVPCSGLGVIHKKPDIRHKNPQDIEKLPTVQYSILCASSQYLKVGGKLLYSTCTLNKAENDDITEKFLNEHRDFRRVSGEKKGITSFPALLEGIVKNDGFYTDVIERFR